MLLDTFLSNNSERSSLCYGMNTTWKHKIETLLTRGLTPGRIKFLQGCLTQVEWPQFPSEHQRKIINSLWKHHGLSDVEREVLESLGR